MTPKFPSETSATPPPSQPDSSKAALPPDPASDKNADLTSPVSASHALGTFLLSLPADHLDHLDDNGDHLDHNDDNGDHLHYSDHTVPTWLLNVLSCSGKQSNII